MEDVLERLLGAHLLAVSTRTSLQRIAEAITEKIAEKNTIIVMLIISKSFISIHQEYVFFTDSLCVKDYLFLYKHAVMMTPPEFDESSNWGLKPLRHTLMPPYFKNWGAQITAPMVFNRTPISPLIVQMTSTKQKCERSQLVIQKLRNNLNIVSFRDYQRLNRIAIMYSQDSFGEKTR